MFRHGLRTSEPCALRWADVDLGRGTVHVRRIKNGEPSVQPLAIMPHRYSPGLRFAPSGLARYSTTSVPLVCWWKSSKNS